MTAASIVAVVKEEEAAARGTILPLHSRGGGDGDMDADGHGVHAPTAACPKSGDTAARARDVEVRGARHPSRSAAALRLKIWSRGRASERVRSLLEKCDGK